MATEERDVRGLALVTGGARGIGFGLIVAIHIMIRSVSVLQVLEVIGLSLVQVVVALGLARLTVYRLAD